MTRTILAIVFAASLLVPAGSAVVYGQQKIGFIDSEFVLGNVPEYEGVSQRLQTMARNWREEIDELEVEIERLRQEFEAREILFTPDVRRQRQEEIDQRVRDRQRMIDQRFGPEGDYFRQQQELLEPIQQRILMAVAAVAERGGYDHVFDRSGDYLFLYTKEEWNLSRQVLQEMGILLDDNDI